MTFQRARTFKTENPSARPSPSPFAPRPFREPAKQRSGPPPGLAAPRPATAAPESVQRVAVFWSGATVRRPKEGEEEAALETRTLDRASRAELVALLKRKTTTREEGAANEKLLSEIEAEWRREKPTSAQLVPIQAELTRLEAVKDLDEEQTASIATQIDELNKILQAIPNLHPTDEREEAQTLRDSVGGLLLRAEALWAKSPHQKTVKRKKLGEAAAGITAEEITQEEIDAYREDIKDLGVWGGLAEAEQGAQLLDLQTAIFRLSGDRYQRILTLGAGCRDRPQRYLLHRGNHYEVVGNVAEGDEYDDADKVADTETDGNCLFEALFIARAGRKLRAQDRVPAITSLRRRIAAPERLTDEMIRASLLQIYTHGETGGLGHRTRAFVESRRYAPAQVETLLKAGGLDSEGYKDLLASYTAAWKKDPRSQETQNLYLALRKLLGAEGKAGPHGIKAVFLKDHPPQGDILPVIWDNNKVGLKFEVHALFDPDRTEEKEGKYYTGEYRQLIRGFFKVGSQPDQDHTLAFGKKMSRSALQEDGNGSQPPYGHRDKARNHDQYVTLGDGRGAYSALDSPSIPVDPGEVVRISLEFVGQLVEVEVDTKAKSRKVTAILAERTWTVAGKATGGSRRGDIKIEALDSSAQPKPKAKGSTGGTGAPKPGKGGKGSKGGQGGKGKKPKKKP